MTTPEAERSVPLPQIMTAVRALAHDFGITRLSDITYLDCVGLPVFQAVRPQAQTLTVSQGKGMSPDAAEVSATIEAVELAMCEGFPATRPTLVAHVADLGLTYDVHSLVGRGRALNEQEALPWVRATGMSTNRETWVPLATVSVEGRRRRDVPSAFVSSTSGLASGFTETDACLHALLELIERDALTTAFRSGALSELARRPDCASVHQVYDMLERVGLSVRLFPVRSRWQVPCVLAVLDPGAGVDRAFLGSAASVQPSTAALKALSEALQSRLTFIMGMRDDIDPTAYTVPTPIPNFCCSFTEPEPDLPASSTAEQLAHLVRESVRAVGCEPLVVASSGPHGLHTVRVIGPGFRAFHE